MSDKTNPIVTIDTSRVAANPVLHRLIAEVIENFDIAGCSVEAGESYDRSTVYVYAPSPGDEVDLDDLRARLSAEKAADE